MDPAHSAMQEQTPMSTYFNIWSRQPPAQKPFRFLDLPSEIRNQIYQEVLVSPRTFTLRRPAERSHSDTSLLSVNKQVHTEASGIFYHDNVFWFPAYVFDGPPSFPILVNECGLPLRRLMTLKKFIIDINIHRVQKPSKRILIARNIHTLCNFIAHYNGPGLKVSVDLRTEGYGCEDWMMPGQYRAFLQPWARLREEVTRQQGDLEIIIRTSPIYLEEWFSLLPTEFGDSWFIVMNMKVSLAALFRFRLLALRKFGGYDLAERCDRTADDFIFTVSPRRGPDVTPVYGWFGALGRQVRKSRTTNHAGEDIVVLSR